MGYIPIPFQKPRKKRVRNMNPAPQPRRVYRDEPITDPEYTMGPPSVNSPENLRLWARQQANVGGSRAARFREPDTPVNKLRRLFGWDVK